MAATTDGVPKRKKSLNIKDARIAGLYDLEQTIGQGHFAIVKRAKHVFTQEQVAVKIIDKDNLDIESREHMMQEVRCMKLVQHPNIVRLYEVIDTQTKLFLILELGDYDMHDFILKYEEKGCPEPLAQQYFSQIIKAISYCHKLHVVHRDLKPENVVFFEQLGMVKLTDFGFSNNYEPGTQLKTSCGSLAYSAPEILLGDAYDAPAVDVWSLGVILYMLVVGRLPFQETNDSETLTRILDCRFTLPDTLSPACRNLIARMLVREGKKRASLPEISSNPWVQQGDRGHAEAIPLIERHHLPEEAHQTIIDQMVQGHIGSADSILNALENDDYNYMSATYYLLAERVLAACRFEKAKALTEENRENSLPEEDIIESADARTGVLPQQSATTAQRCRSRSNSWRATRRPCSILKEESEEELSTYYRSSSRHSSRNSSPAMSMFGGSVRDRLSPQYAHGIQDLLEVVKPMRRAASPDSVRSSRSPSPPASSSGRTSPSMSSLSLSRFKTSCTIGGMRKLSSSPHLLGICEEGEELMDNSQSSSSPAHHHHQGGGSGGTSGHSSLLLHTNNDATQPPTPRANRSASTGLVIVGPRHRLISSKSAGQQPTYSSVRMIRPRQAIVSPDVLRRYESPKGAASADGARDEGARDEGARDEGARDEEPPITAILPSTSTQPPPPRFFLQNSRRSTSCSSSEASDDEERNRARLLMEGGEAMMMMMMITDKAAAQWAVDGCARPEMDQPVNNAAALAQQESLSSSRRTSIEQDVTNERLRSTTDDAECSTHDSTESSSLQKKMFPSRQPEDPLKMTRNKREQVKRMLSSQFASTSSSLWPDLATVQMAVLAQDGDEAVRKLATRRPAATRAALRGGWRMMVTRPSGQWLPAGRLLGGRPYVVRV
ncbi:unnamed protein product, partial [Mesorhabditis spiculigera]